MTEHDPINDAMEDWDEAQAEHEDRPAPPPIPGRLLDLIEEMIDDLEGARGSALSPTVKVDRNTFLAKLRELEAALPEELRAARRGRLARCVGTTSLPPPRCPIA